MVSEVGYKPGPDFEEDAKDPLVDISLTDSTELWLIQWPINQLQPADFHGKELTLKLHRDGTLGSFEGSSGKCYDVVSYAAQEPDANVFLASQSESKVVGKISRRVCLVHYPEPGELEKPGLGNLNLSSQKSEGSFRKSMSRHTAAPLRHGSLLGIAGMSNETLTSASLGEKSSEFLRKSKQKSHERTKAPSGTSTRSTHASEISKKSSHRLFRASGLDSQVTSTSLGSEPSDRGKPKKKNKVKVE